MNTSSLRPHYIVITSSVGIMTSSVGIIDAGRCFELEVLKRPLRNVFVLCVSVLGLVQNIMGYYKPCVNVS
jgi:hypothetical protein